MVRKGRIVPDKNSTSGASRARIIEVVMVFAVVGALVADLQLSGLTMNSRAWPLIILGLMAVVALSMLPGALARNSSSGVSGDTVSEKPDTDGQVATESPAKRYGMMAVYSAFIISLPYLGFLVATLIFVPIASRLLGMPSTMKHILFSLVAAVSIYLLFGVAFGVPLPEGFATGMNRWL